MTTQALLALPDGKTYEFGLTDRLQAAREQAGLTTRELAKALGISAATVANYENGNSKIKRAMLIAWALATGFSAQWILTGMAKVAENVNQAPPTGLEPVTL